MGAIEILQTIYYLSGIVLAGGVVIGAIQIQQSKRASEENAKRNAYSLSMKQCDMFKEIIKKYDLLRNKAKNKKLKFFSDYEVVPKKDYFITKFNKKVNIKTQNKIIELEPSPINILNELEAFSIPLTTKIPNEIIEEDIVFASTGKTFCRMFENLVLFTFKGLPNKKTNIKRLYSEPHMKLYKKWKIKLKEKEIESLNKSLEIVKKDINSDLKKDEAKLKKTIAKIKEEILEITK